MKKIELFEMIAGLFDFKTVRDEADNEYVLYAGSPLYSAGGMNITDRTGFEAVANHVHLADNVKNDEFERWIRVGDVLGRLLADRLKGQFPQKKFVVFVTVSLHDSVIVRFHQKWAGEPPYYDVSCPCEKGEHLAVFE